MPVGAEENYLCMGNLLGNRVRLYLLLTNMLHLHLKLLYHMCTVTVKQQQQLCVGI